MKSLNETNFDEEIATDQLVVFWATWCGPCVETKYLEEFELSTNIPVGRVNFEENPKLVAQYSVVVVPTYILFRKKEPIKKLIGLQTKETLQEII